MTAGAFFPDCWSISVLVWLNAPGVFPFDFSSTMLCTPSVCQCCLLYKTLVGAQMRYAVHDRNGWPLAMLGFSTAAWKLAPRDHFIGWTPQACEQNLSLAVDNPRFLILPWIEIPNLGSHILSIVRRRLPEDWAERYNTTPVLIETPRFTGAVYRASGWLHVGTTRGRRRYDRDELYDKPRKDVWLRPLRRDWKRILSR